MDKKEYVEHPERDQRSVFAYDIPKKANKGEVKRFFSQAGKVRAVTFEDDENSKTSKVGRIEFDDARFVASARALSGRSFSGKPLVVTPKPQPQNKLVESLTQTQTTSTTICVRNLPPAILENHLIMLFHPFGTVKRVSFPPEFDGSAHVQFYDLEDAEDSLILNGQVQIGDHIIEVVASDNQLEDDGAELQEDDGAELQEDDGAE
ncbi:hypothetical protein OROMI_009648 [Orobanche minor]